LRERPERRGYLLPAPQGLPHMSSLMSFPISLDKSLLLLSSPTTNKKVQKNGVKSKEGGKKVVSALPRKAASRGRLPAVKYCLFVCLLTLESGNED
jgi:hypothetical protein